MMTYKVILRGKVIDVVQNPTYLRFLSSGCIAFTDKTSAQGIVGSDGRTLYSFGINHPKATIAKVESITVEEFNRLSSLLNSDKEVYADESLVERAKQEILKQISAVCKKTITSGFSIVLSDGKSYNFKLTAEDQLNLLNLENQLNAGGDSFVYHAAGMPCQVFRRADMEHIIRAFRKHTLYHTTYFNVAKQYINSLTDVDKVKSFVYGMDLSNTITDPVIRQILKKGGSYR